MSTPVAPVQDQLMQAIDREYARNGKQAFDGSEILGYISKLGTLVAGRTLPALKQLGWVTYDQSKAGGKLINIRPVPQDQRPPRPDRVPNPANIRNADLLARIETLEEDRARQGRLAIVLTQRLDRLEGRS